jgi:hypothetical protein
MITAEDMRVILEENPVSEEDKILYWMREAKEAKARIWDLERELETLRSSKA